MALEDLRLPIERKVIGVLGDQHLRQQRRRRQPTGDRPLGGRRLDDRLAGAAGVLGPADADHAKLRRDPVQHRSNALADGMDGAAAVRAATVRDVDQHVFARQVVGKRLALRLRLGGRLEHPRTATFRVRQVRLDVLQGERQLVGIQALGAAAELRPLQLLDDRLEPVDLPVTTSTTAAMSRTSCCSRAVSEGRLSRSNRMADSTHVRVMRQADIPCGISH